MENIQLKKLKKTKLDQIIKAYKVPKNIELLNIDVEGHEIVLQGINLKLLDLGS